MGHIQDANGRGDNATGQINAAAFVSQPVVGNYIFVAIAVTFASGPLTSVQDNQGNTYTIDKYQKNGNALSAIASAKVDFSSGSFVVSITVAGTGNYAIFSASEFSGIASSSPLDAIGNGTSPLGFGTTTDVITASGVNGGSGDISISALCFSGTGSDVHIVNTSGYTNIFVNSNPGSFGAGSFDYKVESGVVTSSSTYTYDFCTDDESGVIATYKVAGATARFILGSH